MYTYHVGYDMFFFYERKIILFLHDKAQMFYVDIIV